MASVTASVLTYTQSVQRTLCGQEDAGASSLGRGVEAEGEGCLDVPGLSCAPETPGLTCVPRQTLAVEGVG